MTTPLVPLIGLETEYGIIRENAAESDPVEESMALLRRCARPSVFGLWDYSRERSHLDQRGFTVQRLAQDEEEDEFCRQDQKRSYGYREMKSDRVLTNGARFYNDHTHPEYCTPECADVFQLAAHDAAGERIVAECARLRNQELGENPVQLYKNNTDYSGHSYGTHDNYLIPRALPFAAWVESLTPFLVTRQLYAGAGKVGSECKRSGAFTGLQLSQRADFIETLLSIETMTQRPIINTRDEPHATAKDWRRLHLILGDANMSPYATALKVGATQIVLSLAGEKKLAAAPTLDDPVLAVRQVARDRTGKTPLRRAGGGSITPLAIQEWYLAAAKKNYAGLRRDWDWVMAEWERTLDDLGQRPEKLADRIDWAIKLNLFTRFMDEEKIGWDDPWLQSLDLEYHNLDPERGLYRGLEQEGALFRFLDERDVDAALSQPPPNTRAWFRGQAVATRAGAVRSIHWTGAGFDGGEFLDLTGIITPADVAGLLQSHKEQCAWI